MSDKKSAVLELEDGTKFTGFSFGAEVSAAGEAVFNTAMVGYPELLSDPSARGQIVVMTYPLIGNYGVPPLEDGLSSGYESGDMQIAGLVVADYSERFSHWDAARSLADWLRESGVPAICGVDTREVAKHLRDKGEMRGRIVVDGASESVAREPRGLSGEFGTGDITICAVGGGLKNSIVASLTRRGARVTTDASGFYDGMLITAPEGGSMVEYNACETEIATVRAALRAGKPILGVCGGDLLLALAAGGAVKKLAHPHRGVNQPVREVGTDRAFITTQNHGRAVEADSLPKDWAVWFTNLNDGSVEGIRRRDGFARAVQFHPEPTLRPQEADKLYDNFIAAVRDGK